MGGISKGARIESPKIYSCGLFYFDLNKPSLCWGKKGVVDDERPLEILLVDSRILLL